MSENENKSPRRRPKIETAAYHASKHTRVITDTDLAAVIEGLFGVSAAAARVDIAFPDPEATKGLFG